MARMIHPLAGLKAQPGHLAVRGQMFNAYYSPPGTLKPVKNGTSGHRGRTGSGFSEQHVRAITQALCDIRSQRGTYGPDLPLAFAEQFEGRENGPVIVGKDVRFASDLAQRTTAQVFAGNGVSVVLHKGDRATPTPVVSYEIHRRNIAGDRVEGVIITASHNALDEAGSKSNGLDGGPNTRTGEIDDLANGYMADPTQVRSMPYAEAVDKGLIIEGDLMTPYVTDLANVVKMDLIRQGSFAASPLGGAANGYYEAINGIHGTNIKVVLGKPDPAGADRTYDWDGVLRGDPSSPYVMKAVEGYRQKLDVPFIGANDNDADRFGGEDSTGILDPNHVLCVLFDYLAKTRNWPSSMGIGRTIGSTHMLDVIAARHGRLHEEVDVGWKYYVRGVLEGKYVLAGEESSGLVFPRLDGSLWVTEKDGIAAVLLMMEIIAHTGKDIGTLYGELVSQYGPYQYERVDAHASDALKGRLIDLSKDPDEVRRLLSGKKIAGKEIVKLMIGEQERVKDGIKMVLEGGIWVLKRPSGTEPVLKVYHEEQGETLDTARAASEEMDHYLGLAGL